MTFNLQEVARAMGAEGNVASVAVSGWSVDTRTQNVGDVYFALHGPNHDGHQFVATALEKGASAVVVSTTTRAAAVRDRLLLVPDTLRALQDAGAWARGQWGGTV